MSPLLEWILTDDLTIWNARVQLAQLEQIINERINGGNTDGQIQGV